MSGRNYDDVVGQLQAIGLVLDRSLEFDSRIQRWRVDGEDHEKRGWSRLREWQARDGTLYIVGVYGVWHGNDDGRLKIELRKDDSARLDQDDIRAMREAHKEAQKRIGEIRKTEAKTAGRWAGQVWSHCKLASGDHEYLARKRVKPHGTRLLESIDGLVIDGIDDSNFWRLKQAVGALVVPMHDEHGRVCGIQFVYPKGHPRVAKVGKEFWPAGMAMGGTFGAIGPIKRDGVILIAEGFATAASIHEATGETVVYAFAANNLVKTGRLLRKTCPQSRLLFCADDDYLSDGNPGVAAASSASAEIERSAWTKPDFSDADGNDLRAGKKLTDYNDLYILHGLHQPLASQINACLDGLKWRSTLIPAPAEPQQGGGENGLRDAVSVMTLDDIVKRFVKIDSRDGKSVFDYWTYELVSMDKVVSLFEAGVRLDDLKRHPVWRGRAYYLRDIGFDPSESDPYVKLNTWRGWPMKPKRGTCTMLIELAAYLCSAEKDPQGSFEWLMKWMALPLQQPGSKMQTAIIMHGPQGTGKSTLFRALARIYGFLGDPWRNYAVVIGSEGLEKNFNADWDDKLFILAEEVVSSQDKWRLKNAIKEFVTGDTVRVEAKHVDAIHKRNRFNMAFLSNEEQPWPLDEGDRRNHVIYTPPALSRRFYKDLQAELDAGGYEAFYDYLLSIDLTDFEESTKPPLTEAKQRLIAISAPSEIRFLTEWVLGEIGLPICPCIAADLYSAYLRWCRTNGETRPRPSNQFFGAIMHRPGWAKRKVRYYETEHAASAESLKPVVFPPEHEQDDRSEKDKAGVGPGVWVGRCVRRFSEACSSAETRHAA